MTAFDPMRVPLVAARTPLLPLDTICNVFAAPNPIDALRRQLESTRIVRQAIYVASTSLAESVDAWCATGAAPKNSVPYGALAYLARMSARPTPFGICAGIGIVDTGDRTTLSIDIQGRRTRTRPDMALMERAEERLLEGEASGRVRYVANNAILKRGDRLYVANVRLTSPAGGRTNQRPVTLKETEAVKYVRSIAAEPIERDALTARLSRTFGVSVEEAGRVVGALIDAGILVSELRASPIGDPVGYLFERLAEIDVSLTAKIAGARARAAALDASPLGERPTESYKQLVRDYEVLGGSAGRAMQVDLHVPLSGTLRSAVLTDVAELATCLAQMGARYSLKTFQDRFLERYGGRERVVPLLELIDDNVGLGNPSDIDLVGDAKAESKREMLLSELASDAVRTGAEEVVLSPEQLAVLAPPLPADVELQPLEVGFQIIAASSEAVDNGDYLIAPDGFTFASGCARSFGRFLDMLGNDCSSRIRSALSEGGDDAIYAELVYVPSLLRNYNVFTRPRLLDTEIRAGVFDVSETDQLRLEDLWVGLDDLGFFLWSRSRQKRVRPIENHVFGTARLAPNLCRFLSFLGLEGTWTPRALSWGLAATFTYLPRVRVGRVVLSPRQWRFDAREFRRSPEAAANRLAKLRFEWSLPRYVLFCESDNRLIIDLDSSVAGAFLHWLIPASAPYVRLEEMFQTPDRAWLRTENGDGPFVAEFVCTVLPRKRKRPAQKGHRIPPILATRVRHGPGSDWVYYKIYTGSQAAEDLLLRVIAPAIERWRCENTLDRWFFLRFADPDSHIRLRLRARSGHSSLVREESSRLLERELSQESIDRYAIDTYDPEYERYGGPEALPLVEKFFSVDSDVCLARLGGAQRSADARVALAAETFYPWLAGSEALRELAIESFAARAKAKLNATDRQALKRLVALEATLLPRPDLAEIIAEKSEAAGALLSSLMHMHCNRLGVPPSVEGRAVTLLRGMLLSRQALARAKPLELAECGLACGEGRRNDD